MTLFCDTSALIKLLIEEPDSERMLRAAAAAEWIAVCRITWAEATAAMARRAREDPASAEAIEQARQGLSRLWRALVIDDVNQLLFVRQWRPLRLRLLLLRRAHWPAGLTAF